MKYKWCNSYYSSVTFWHQSLSVKLTEPFRSDKTMTWRTSRSWGGDVISHCHGKPISDRVTMAVCGERWWTITQLLQQRKNKRNWYKYTVNWHQFEALMCHLTFHCLLQFRRAALADLARCLEMYHPPSPQTDQVTTVPKIYITRRVGIEKLQLPQNSPLLRSQRKTMI